MHPDTQKRHRTRANRNYRALLKEKASRFGIDDGAGKRYRIGVDYVLAGDMRKALEYYAWYENEFSDDIGEPVHDLYWALALYRSGNRPEAERRLPHVMLQNLYLLPHLFHEPLPPLDIWHGSNREEPGYLLGIADYLDEPTEEERRWMKTAYESDAFKRLR